MELLRLPRTTRRERLSINGVCFCDYLRHGILHILTGYDHLLFISALVLAVVLCGPDQGDHRLHSRALHHFNLVRFGRGPPAGTSGRANDRREHCLRGAAKCLLAAAQPRDGGVLVWPSSLGLFHGLGFAGGLLSAMEGMTGLAIGSPLLLFSLGVEIGHQVVVLPLFGVLRGPAADKGKRPIVWPMACSVTGRPRLRSPAWSTSCCASHSLGIDLRMARWERHLALSSPILRVLGVIIVLTRAFTFTAHSQDGPKDATILIIRHAEKPADGSASGLTAEGEKRARAYAGYFRDFRVDSKPSAYRRDFRDGRFNGQSASAIDRHTAGLMRWG